MKKIELTKDEFDFMLNQLEIRLIEVVRKFDNNPNDTLAKQNFMMLGDIISKIEEK